MLQDRTTAELVDAARSGDSAAWDELVDRYAGLVMGSCRRMRLTDADALDVSQTVWLRLVEQLPALREPAALPGWLVTTARHEALRLLRRPARSPLLGEHDESVVATDDAVDADLLAAERRSALRQAFAALPPAWRQLIELLVTDPPLPYAEISRRLDIPVGSIGPTRARILDRLRRDPGLAALLREDEAEQRPASRPRGVAQSRRQ